MPRRRPDPFRARLGVELLAARCLPSAVPPAAPLVPDFTPSVAVVIFSSPSGTPWVSDTFDIAASASGGVTPVRGQGTPSPPGPTAGVGVEKMFAAPGPIALAADADGRPPGPSGLWATRPPDEILPGRTLARPLPAPALPQLPAANPAQRDLWSGPVDMWAAPHRAADRAAPPAWSGTPRDARGETRSAPWTVTPLARTPLDPSGDLWRAVRVADPLPPRPVVHAVAQSQYEGGEVGRPGPPVALPGIFPCGRTPPAPASRGDERLAWFAAEPTGAVPDPADPIESPAEPETDLWWVGSARLAGWAAAAWVTVRSLAASVRWPSPRERPDGSLPGALSDEGDRNGGLRVETIDGPFPL